MDGKINIKFGALIPLFYFLLILFFIQCTSLKEGNYLENIGGINLSYSVKGHGPVMIAGHLTSGKTGYELTLTPLEKYFTMVYYDPRGTGKSEAPPNMEEYNIDEVVNEIEDLRIKLNREKIWIFGHSDQSGVAMIYALKYPQHTSGLILTGTSVAGTQEESIQRRKASELNRASESTWFATLIRAWDEMNKNNSDRDNYGNKLNDIKVKWWCYDEAFSQKVIPVIRKIDEAGRKKPVNNIDDSESEDERNQYLEYQKDFNKIKCPVLIINGKYDTNNPPEYAEQLNQILPNSKLVIINKAGHFPWIENADITFDEIINWVKINL